MTQTIKLQLHTVTMPLMEVFANIIKSWSKIMSRTSAALSSMKTRRTALALAVTLMGTIGGVSSMTSAANAQAATWEAACEQKVYSTRNNDTLREIYCSRQRDCQADANRRGAPAFGNGCFGVAPSANYSR